jgi:hypothetical protein
MSGVQGVAEADIDLECDGRSVEIGGDRGVVVLDVLVQQRTPVARLAENGRQLLPGLGSDAPTTVLNLRRVRCEPSGPLATMQSPLTWTRCVGLP